MPTDPVRPSLSVFLAFGAGLLYSAAMIMAFPPVGVWPLALVAVLPLVWLGSRGEAVRFRHYAALFAGVLFFWTYTLWWIYEIAGPGYPCLATLKSSWPVLFVWLLARVVRRWPRLPLVVSVPILWTGVEFFRGEIFADGYAFSLIAYPLIDAPILSGAATVVGVYGVVALVALLSGVAGDATFAGTRRRAASLTGLAVWAAATFLGFVAARRPVETRSLPVALVQTNVPQSNKIGWTAAQQVEDYERFERMTKRAAAEPVRPALVVWPETMLPGMTLEPAALAELEAHHLALMVPGRAPIPAGEFAARVRALSKEIGIPMLVGEDAIEGLHVKRVDGGYEFDQDRRYNSVYLLGDGEIGGARYDKVCLTPFGETMPYISNWPWLEQKMLDVAARGMAFDLSKGSRMTVFDVPTPSNVVRAVTPICFETTVGPHCRRLVYGPGGERRAGVIVNLTNDGWFGSSDTAREQHLQIARWRCLELGTPMLRAANTGISAFIDASGRITRRGIDGDAAGRRVEGVLSGEVRIAVGPGAIYGRLGDVVPWSLLVASFGLAVSSFLGGSHRGRGSGADSVVAASPNSSRS